MELPPGAPYRELNIYIGAMTKMEATGQILIVDLEIFFVKAPECIRSPDPIVQKCSSLLELPTRSSIYT